MTTHDRWPAVGRVVRLFVLTWVLSWTPVMPAAAMPRSVPAVVIHVSDGDSLWVRTATAPRLELRLRDIDAPEICQAWGAQARDALQARVLGREVTLRGGGRDRYGRTLARLQLGDSDVGTWMVAQGHAWALRSGRGGVLRDEEDRARALRRGLHGQPGALRPGDFRRQHGPCERTAAR